MDNGRSSITFSEMCGHLAWTKVTWNGRVVFDSMLDKGFESWDDMVSFYGRDYVDSHTGSSGVEYVNMTYGPLKVYSVFVCVVGFHHAELTVEGEEPSGK